MRYLITSFLFLGLCSCNLFHPNRTVEAPSVTAVPSKSTRVVDYGPTYKDMRTLDRPANAQYPTSERVGVRPAIPAPPIDVVPSPSSDRVEAPAVPSVMAVTLEPEIEFIPLPKPE